MKLDCYKPADCCGQHECDFLEGNPDQPCWGQVECVDEVQISEDDHAWVHACEGHREITQTGTYYPKQNEIQ